MKKAILVLGASMLALAGSASAKDGFYMGLGLVYQTNDNVATQSVAPSSGIGWFVPLNRAAINATNAADISTDSFGGSLFFGYKANLVDKLSGAIEVDATAFDGKADKVGPSTAYPTPPGTFQLTNSFSQRDLYTARVKLGVDITPSAFVYVTGGAAAAQVKLSTTFADTYTLPQRILSQAGTTSSFKSGYVFGAGADVHLGGTTSLRLDYLRADLGTIQNSRALTFSTGASANNEVLVGKAKLTESLIRVGLAWDLNL